MKKYYKYNVIVKDIIENILFFIILTFLVTIIQLYFIK